MAMAFYRHNRECCIGLYRHAASYNKFVVVEGQDKSREILFKLIYFLRFHLKFICLKENRKLWNNSA